MNEAIFSRYKIGDHVLILLQGGRAFEGVLSGVCSDAGYVVIIDTAGSAKREVYIPLPAIVAVTRPWE